MDASINTLRQERGGCGLAGSGHIHISQMAEWKEIDLVRDASLDSAVFFGLLSACDRFALFLLIYNTLDFPWPPCAVHSLCLQGVQLEDISLSSLECLAMSIIFSFYTDAHKLGKWSTVQSHLLEGLGFEPLSLGPQAHVLAPNAIYLTYQTKRETFRAQDEARANARCFPALSRVIPKARGLDLSSLMCVYSRYKADILPCSCLHQSNSLNELTSKSWWMASRKEMGSS